MSLSKPKSHFVGVILDHRRYYITAIGVAFLSMFFIFTIPVILKDVIDIILTDQTNDVSDFAWWLIGLIGGQKVLAQNLWIAALVVFGLYVVFSILIALTILLAGLAAESISREIRNRLYRKFQRLSYAFFSGEKTGDLIQRSTSDVMAAHAFLSNQLAEIGRTIVMILLLVPYMFLINAKMAALSLVTTPILGIVVFYYFRLLIRRSVVIEENESEMTSAIQENLSGIRVVRAFARHAYEREKFKKRSQAYHDSALNRIDTFARFFSFATTLSFGQLGIVLIFGSWMVIYEWVSVGTLVAFFSYASAIAFNLRGLGIMLGETGGAVVAIGRIDRILEMPVPERSTEASANAPLQGEIRFENVSFAYETGNKVLDEVSFHIKTGERIAIVGPSGSGKSTLIELLLKNYQPQSGSISLDGKNLQELEAETVRSQIGTSLQEVFLFSDTVRSNITMAKSEATEGEVVTASETARIHDTIDGLPEKYETTIGELGVDLSGGQRQRMVLARTFIKKPPILILDDSLSAVDVHTEREILSELNKKHSDVTVIIVTHRLSCCLNADRILVLENGKLTKSGHHNQLIQEDGFYQRLWGIQQEIEQIAESAAAAS